MLSSTFIFTFDLITVIPSTPQVKDLDAIAYANANQEKTRLAIVLIALDDFINWLT